MPADQRAAPPPAKTNRVNGQGSGEDAFENRVGSDAHDGLGGSGDAAIGEGLTFAKACFGRRMQIRCLGQSVGAWLFKFIAYVLRIGYVSHKCSCM